MKNLWYLIIFTLLSIGGCKSDDPPAPVEVSLSDGVFIVNQGTFTASNASLSYLENEQSVLYNNLFAAVNGAPLGDVAQSISMYNGLAYIVVNNSGLIYAIDSRSCVVQGKISNLGSPRFMQIVNDQKAYVSDLFNFEVNIVNPSTYEVTGKINIGRTSEEMAMIGTDVFIANWSGYNQGEIINDRIMVVNSNTDQLSDTIKVGIEPNSMVVDKDNHLWVLCSGGYEYTEKPTLWKIDGQTHDILKTLTFPDLYTSPVELEINGTGDSLFYLNKGVYKMAISADTIPEEPFIQQINDRVFLYLGVDPVNGNIYISNPKDYLSTGIVYQYNKLGYYKAGFETGVVPADFGFNY